MAHAEIPVALGWVAQAVGPEILWCVIGLSLLAVAGWMLIPDKIGANAAGGKRRFGVLGVFGATGAAFFLAEMGDKTQIATVTLAARHPDLVQVVLGTTLGMMLANVPGPWRWNPPGLDIPLPQAGREPDLAVP